MLRLLPCIWVTAPFVALIPALNHSATVSHQVESLVDALFILPRAPGVDIVYWTLSVELSFYALAFGAVLLLKRSFAEIGAALILISGAAWGAEVASGLLHLSGMKSAIDHLLDAYRARLLLVRHGAFFGLGVMLYEVATSGLTRSRLLLIAVAMVVCACETARQSVEVLGVVRPNPLVPVAVWGVATAIVAASVSASGAVSGLQRLAGPIRFLGQMTYPLYLVHNVAGVMLERFLIARGVSGAVAPVIALLTALAVAASLAKWIEPLARAWLDRVLPHTAFTAKNTFGRAA